MQAVSNPVTQRRKRAQDLLEAAAIDILLVAPSGDLRYLTGYDAHPGVRPTLLMVTHDRTVMVVPELEVAKTADLQDLPIATYGETENPYQLLASQLDAAVSSPRAAISDRAWAGVLLRLQAAIPHASWVSATPLLRELRMRKTEGEVELLRRAGRMADSAFEQLVERRFAGRTERDIASDLRELVLDSGLEPADWGPIVGSGPNGASPHHTAGSREVHEGDAVVLDFGGVLEGYQADITRTVHVGSPDTEFRRVYDVVRQAQEAGVQAVRPGTSAQSVDRAARGVIDAAGYGPFFPHRTGHGIGLEAHEEPYIVEGNALELEAGMAFSVEPGIYLPGRFGVRIEDIVAVTAGGAERMTHAARELLVVH